MGSGLVASSVFTPLKLTIEIQETAETLFLQGRGVVDVPEH